MSFAERLLDEFAKYNGTEIGTLQQAADLIRSAHLTFQVTETQIAVRGPEGTFLAPLVTRRNVLRAARRVGARADMPEGQSFVRFHDLAAAATASVMGRDAMPQATVYQYRDAHTARTALLLKQVAAERKP